MQPNCYVVLSDPAGNADQWLEYTVGSAVRVLGSDRVKIISTCGDHGITSCEIIEPRRGTGHEMVEKYMSDAGKRSRMPHFHGLGWFRWGALLDVIKERKETSLISADPDEIVFMDPSTSTHSKVAPNVLTRSAPSGPGGFTASLSVLSDIMLDTLCKTFMDGGTSWDNDMEIWSELANCHWIVDGSIPREGQAFDHNICTTDGWEDDGKRKKLYFPGPYANHLQHGKVKLVNVHCWDKDMDLMRMCYEHA